MDWQDLITRIVIWVVGAIVSGFGAFAIRWIKAKIKNEKIQNILIGAVSIVDDGVKFTYQTFVEEIKGTDLWNEDAKQAAVEKTVNYVKTKLTPAAKTYIMDNYGDITQWIKEQIEIQINNEKNRAK